MHILRALACLPIAVLLPIAACGGDNRGGTPPAPTGNDGGKTPVDGGGDGAPTPLGKGDLPPNPDAKITECARPPLPAATGTCEVTKTGSGSRIFRGTVLVPDEVLRRGEVVVDDQGIITCAACDCSDAAGYDTASVVTCADGVISPGLINPHDHITYANNAPIAHGTDRYEHRHDWRTGGRGHKKLTTKSGASANVVRFAELRYIMAGVTAAAAAGGQKGLVRNLDDDDPALFEGLPVKTANSDTFPLGDSNGTLNASGCSYGQSRTTSASIDSLDAYLPHISEGIDEEAHNEFVCTSSSDADVGKQDLIKKQTAVIHGIAMKADDVAIYRNDLAMVVWSPRSNVDLYGNTAPVTMFDAMGVPVALGTDWVPSGSMNLLRELRCADSLNKKYYGKHFADVDLWRMVTANAASAVGAAHVIGSLKAGYVADIAIYNGATRRDHRAVIDGGVEDVVLVMRGGKALYGDKALMEDAVIGASDCEDFATDVCGVSKKACVGKDIGGVTLGGIRAAGEAVYPLFFCRDDVPTSEPSCEPYRVEYPDGVTSEDKDGDGIANDKDNCPSIFNPVRGLDGSKQADVDGDGIGDVCDRCPVDGKNACELVTANDIDGDGIVNAADNCPEAANAGQADSDNDGSGDACDLCKTPNQGGQACPTTIEAIRDPANPDHPQAGAVVSFGNAYVTALKPLPLAGSTRGFFVQTPSTSKAGMFVFTGSTSPAVAIGNKVKISGLYEERFGIPQISNPQITVESTSTTLPFGPIVVTPAEIATGGAKAEDLKCMLVQIDGASAGGAITITNDVPDGATSKFYEFVINGSLRIDDTIFTRYGAPTSGPYPPTGFANGRTFTSITGIHGFSFANAKLWPRNAADMP